MLCHDVCGWVRRIDARIVLLTSALWAGICHDIESVSRDIRGRRGGRGGRSASS